ncbi:serine/threonine protein kinase [Penicillium canariense]|uniref:Serine/threonine protein kinase n=1 Tax=Penicillium canariense TaxID=189055 RepID=A0A9W9HL19_9EURO|nr:serine/threonine protein kinase [Penicillium canariense]KAJ5150825.1 serine/threonine protein kinase [Penicillium canariense]
MSLTWDIRTVLASEAAPVSADDSDGKAASDAEAPLKRLEPIDIWNYLISLSQDGSGSKSDSETDYTKLRHYKATDFNQGWDGVAKYAGDGASYSVDKCTLNQMLDGKPVVVAVKKLKIFQEHSYRDEAEANSAAHQRSVATVLKELRILTHPPLQGHLNIVSLLGYRSEFASGPSSSLYSTNVSLVAEFAPFGTLRDFCQSLSPDKKLDLLTKAHLMHDIASGIEALHKCAIAHGDVKMENTLVFEGYGRPYLAKLSDFGHSLVDLHTPKGESQVYLGTPIFNAPEIRSRSHFVPMEPESLFKCDIYSFGLLCWELVLGGVRYYKTLGELVGTEDITAAVSRLSTLPKDELLFRSIHGSEDASLVQIIVNRVLQACLKDEPNDREDIYTIVKYFRQQQAFSNKLWMLVLRSISLPSTNHHPRRQIGFSSTQDKDKPWAAPLKPFFGTDRPSVATLAIPQMPLVVQTDLVDQLRSAVETSTSKVDKRRSLFDLATCHLSGIGTENVDIPKALGLLAEAAQLGSYQALTLVFRLHVALLGEVPPELWEIKHPITRLESSLSQLDSRVYFPERLRGHEKMQQADALNRIFDTRQKGETILQGVHLQDAHGRLQGFQGLCAEDLECISNLEEDDSDMPQIQGNLLVTAARLGLLPLVEFLLARRVADKALSEDILTAACRGGHIDMLRLLLSNGVSLSADNDPRATPLHWLGGFSPGETGVALELLLSVPGGQECLLQSTPDPGIQIGDCLVSGTPLEIAIATNNTPLVQAFLAINLADINPQDHPKSIGWTTSTYPLAVALNLHHLLPLLFDSEKTYRSSLWTTPSFPPLNLFDLIHPHDPLLPLLIHSHTLPTALSYTITFIMSIGTTTLNFPSPSVTTPSPTPFATLPAASPSSPSHPSSPSARALAPPKKPKPCPSPPPSSSAATPPPHPSSPTSS